MKVKHLTLEEFQEFVTWIEKEKGKEAGVVNLNSYLKEWLNNKGE